MKKSVIICEFNPLHFGHKRLIDFAASFGDVVCVMSGNFVQRGMPACCNKQKRTAHALKAGASLVVELPTVFCTASAENFALGGVKTANALGVDNLVFGSECGDIATLWQCANILDDPEVNKVVRQNLSLGMNYPTAVANACNGFADVLAKPNNVLAAEYLRALKKTDSKITPVTLKRENDFGNNAAALLHCDAEESVSSSALRQDPNLRKKFTYEFVAEDICDQTELRYGKFAAEFLSLAEPAALAEIEGVTEGLENRICAADKTGGFEKMLDEIKTKRYTRAKIRRAILNCVLGIKKSDVEDAKKREILPTALGVARGKEQLLRDVCGKTDIFTQKADRLYAALEGETPSGKLIVL